MIDKPEASPTESSDLCKHGNFKTTCPSCKAIQEGHRGQPFAKELVTSDVSSGFQQFRGDSRYILRSAGVDNLEATIEREREGKLLLKELEQTYSIPVVEAQRVIGHGKLTSKEVVYIIPKKVYGQRLESVIESDRVELTEDIKNKIETHFQSLARYYIDKYKNKKKYLGDIVRSKQYVLGTYSSDKQGEQEIYLVDIESDMRDVEDGDLERFDEGLVYNIEVLVREMVKAERKVGKQFNEPRRLLKDFLLFLPRENLPELLAAYISKS